MSELRISRTLLHLFWWQKSLDSNILFTHFSVEQLMTCCWFKKDPKKWIYLVRILKGKVAKVFVMRFAYWSKSLLFFEDVYSCTDNAQRCAYIPKRNLHHPNFIWNLLTKNAVEALAFSVSRLWTVQKLIPSTPQCKKHVHVCRFMAVALNTLHNRDAKNQFINPLLIKNSWRTHAGRIT